MNIDELRDFVNAVQELQVELKWAKHHIKKHLDAFTPKELECMAMDGILAYAEIPADKRTDFVKYMTREAPTS